MFEAQSGLVVDPRLDLQRLPNHIAIIMDGNGRWAKRQGTPRIMGHRSAVQAVREVVEGCAELSIPYLTLYAFSTENWMRPRAEVNALMQLLVQTIRKEIERLRDNGIRLHAIGSLQSLPDACRKELFQAMHLTRDNSHMNLTLALSYGSRQDLVQAMQNLAYEVLNGSLSPEDINAERISAQLSTSDLPDPELVIRTSGEYRLSNFMLWEIAYSELYVTSKLWPDFRRTDLWDALVDFQGRERRFGKTSEQLHDEHQ
jgi:undecaprenyl diphosphate synthase